jgi:hypothetical protein
MRTKLPTSLLIPLLLVPMFTLQVAAAQTNTAPKIQWQQNYGDYYTLWDTTSITNLIQTCDGGYAFLTIGYAHQNYLHPAILFKLNSTGQIEWTKPFEHFTAATLIQTSDGGYEIAGNWRTPTVYDTQPTLLKTDYNGTLQWNQNYTSIPQQSGIGAILQNRSTVSTAIKTSDGGYAHVDWSLGIIKTDSNNKTQWTKDIKYSEAGAINLGTTTLKFPAIEANMCSLIETSDGALAGVGIALNQGDNVYNCAFCIIKTEAFLPLPTPTQLPTPQPNPNQAADTNLDLTVPVSLVLLILSTLSLLLYWRHRKTAKNLAKSHCYLYLILNARIITAWMNAKELAMIMGKSWTKSP